MNVELYHALLGRDTAVMGLGRDGCAVSTGLTPFVTACRDISPSPFGEGEIKAGALRQRFAATRRRRLGALKRERPLTSTVRNIKSASSLAHCASTCAFDLLTGLFIRAIHRMALIPGPPHVWGLCPPPPGLFSMYSYCVAETPSMALHRRARQRPVGG